MARIGATADKTASKTARAGGAKPTSKARASGGSFVGIDIGTQTIKAVEVKGFRNNLAVTAYGTAPTPPGVIQSGIVSDPKTLGAAIKMLMKKIGAKSKNTVTAAAGADGVVVRVIEVAPMAGNELKEMMKYEVERHIPFSANDIEMSYVPIAPDGPVDPNMPPTTMEVLLAVARRDMINLHLNTLGAAGAQPVAIDIEPLAVGRAMLDLSKNALDTKNVVIVNIGAAMTDVGVYKSGILRFPRTVPIAGDNFTRAISDHLGVTMDVAEEEKRQSATILMDLVGRGADNPFGAPTGGDSPFDIDFGGANASPFDIPSAPVSASPFDIPAATEIRIVSEPSPFDLPSAPPTAMSEPAADNPFAIPGGFDPYANATTPAESAPSVAQSVEPTPFVISAPAPAAPVTSLATEDPNQRRRKDIFDALLPALGEFAMEVRRSVDYFRSRYPNEAVDQVILIGGSAKIGNLDKYIEYELGIPTIVGDPIGNVSAPLKQGRPMGGSSEYAVALGLAARDAIIGKD